MPSKLYSNSSDVLVGINDNAQEPIEMNANSDAPDATMSINNNAQEPGKTNANEVHNYQHATAPAQIHVLTEQKYDH